VSSRQLRQGLGRCIGVANVDLSEKAVAKEGLRDREELGVVRELEVRFLANRGVSCDAKESTPTVQEAKWGSVVIGEGGLVLVADIDKSKAGKAWGFPL